MPTLREISAREIGAPARIASSTVRSLSARSIAGVADEVAVMSLTEPLAALGIKHMDFVDAGHQGDLAAARGWASVIASGDQSGVSLREPGDTYGVRVGAKLLDNLDVSADPTLAELESLRSHADRDG